jgi:hypothetical protein
MLLGLSKGQPRSTITDSTLLIDISHGSSGDIEPDVRDDASTPSTHHVTYHKALTKEKTFDRKSTVVERQSHPGST